MDGVEHSFGKIDTLHYYYKSPLCNFNYIF